MLQYSFAYGTPELLVDAVLAPSLKARCLLLRARENDPAQRLHAAEC